jgi:hypothetical protein
MGIPEGLKILLEITGGLWKDKPDGSVLKASFGKFLVMLYVTCYI